MKSQDNKKEITELKNKIQKLESTLAADRNGWKRTQADFENFRRKMEEIKTQWLSEANLDLIMKILPILDNFQRAARHVPENLKEDDWAKGVQIIEKQLENLLLQEELTKIEVKPHDQFNPHTHEAISCEENKEYKEGEIIDIVETGYKIGDKIIRPSKVRVAK